MKENDEDWQSATNQVQVFQSSDTHVCCTGRLYLSQL